MSLRTNDGNNDWTFGRGIAGYVRKNDEVQQDIKTRLQLWKGDCFFSPREGVDYENLLDIGTKVLMDQDVKRIIMQTPGVMKISSFSSDIIERVYQAIASVETIHGPIEVKDFTPFPVTEASIFYGDSIYDDPGKVSVYDVTPKIIDDTEVDFRIILTKSEFYYIFVPSDRTAPSIKNRSLEGYAVEVLGAFEKIDNAATFYGISYTAYKRGPIAEASEIDFQITII